MSLKRTADDINMLDLLESKKVKTDNDWISGTTVANYLNGEPLLDWLNLYYNDYHFNENRITRSMKKRFKTKNFVNLKNNSENNPLLQNGLRFESKVYEDLQNKFKNKFVKIFDSTYKELDFNHFSKLTEEQIKMKTPIIAQAVLMDEKTKLRGVVDLLVTGEYINKIFKKHIPVNKNMYYVIDIKWTTMTLCVDGNTIRNEGRFKAYKGQLYIYNYLLGRVQNYTPPIALIMAKSWKIESKIKKDSGFNCYDLAGIIDYSDKDNIFIQKTYDAIQWICKVRNEGLNYSPLNPTIKEMCVNASNQNDNTWGCVKKEILLETKDITQVWNLNQKHRDIAFDKNIKRWDDDDCTTENLDMNQTKISRIVDKILNINRQDNYMILPNKLNDIKDNRYNWKRKFPTDFFVDFETTSEHIMKLDEINLTDSRLNSQIIFMIGVGYEYDNKFHYKCFKMNHLSPNEEKRILKEFKEFIDLLRDELDKKEKYNTRIFHWSNAEPVMLENAFKRHPSLEKMWEDHIEWVDMCDIFTSEPIVVKGSLTFKLKDIANGLFANGLINTNWSESEISDGLSAMMSAMKYYNSDKDENIMESIMKYNKVDCKVLWEILNLLRNLC